MNCDKASIYNRIEMLTKKCKNAHEFDKYSSPRAGSCLSLLFSEWVGTPTREIIDRIMYCGTGLDGCHDSVVVAKSARWGERYHIEQAILVK